MKRACFCWFFLRSFTFSPARSFSLDLTPRSHRDKLTRRQDMHCDLGLINWRLTNTILVALSLRCGPGRGSAGIFSSQRLHASRPPPPPRRHWIMHEPGWEKEGRVCAWRAHRNSFQATKNRLAQEYFSLSPGTLKTILWFRLPVRE